MTKFVKLKLATFIKQIKQHVNEIAKHRDALRDIEHDLNSILDSTNQGLEDLECAIDTLSQYL